MSDQDTPIEDSTTASPEDAVVTDSSASTPAEGDSGTARDPTAGTAFHPGTDEPPEPQGATDGTARPDEPGQPPAQATPEPDDGEPDDPEPDDEDEWSDMEDPVAGLDLPTADSPRTGRSLLEAATGYRHGASEQADDDGGTGDDPDRRGGLINLRANTIGRDANIHLGPEDEPFHRMDDHPVTATALDRATRLFVPPEGVDETVHDLAIETGGLCLVLGPEWTGKYLTAINLARRLRDREPDPGETLSISTYAGPLARAAPLRRFVAKAPKRRIFLLRDLFERGYTPQQLVAEQTAVREQLRRRSIYLVITSAQAVTHFAEIDAPKIEIGRPDLATVLQRHLDFYDAQGYFEPDLKEVVDSALPQVAEHLEHPIHADQFCRRLTALGSREATREDVIELARRLAQIGRSARRSWFRNLSFNHKLYALLVGLFPSTAGSLLDEIYIRAVEYLRQDGLSDLADPRLSGFVDLREEIHVRLDSDRRLAPDLDNAFSQLVYAHEVYEQIKNYNQVLWSLHPIFIDLMERFSSPELWPFRREIGWALGVLCAAHPGRLEDILSRLAAHSSKPVVAAAGFVMAEACRREPERRGDVVELLQTWVRSQRPALTWAAGAALWRAYPDGGGEEGDGAGDDGMMRYKERLLEILGDLAEHSKQVSKQDRDELLEHCRRVESDPRRAFILALGSWITDNFDCFCYAVVRLMEIDPRRTAKHLEGWLGAENGLVAWLARRACGLLFRIAEEPDNRPEGEREAAMLALLHPLIESAAAGDPKPTETAFATVRAWLQEGNADEDPIFRSLLSIANDPEPGVSFLLRRLLADLWLDSECTAARSMAQRLIVRSLALQGMPMHPPGAEQGLLVLDGSQRGTAEGISARAAVLVRALLDSQIDISLVQLGRDDELVGPEEVASTLELRRHPPRPRLLLPALEALGIRHLSLLLILSWGEVLDLPDLGDQAEVDDLRLVAVGYRPPDADSSGVFLLGPSISWGHLFHLETWLTWTRARRIARSDISTWRPRLEEQLDLPAGKALPETLEAWAHRLDDPEAATGRTDLARLVNAFFLAWCDEEPGTCLGLLGDWIGDDPEGPLHRVAIGAARQIFIVLAHRQGPLEDRLRLPLLSCAGSMVQAGWFAAEAVFYMARHRLAEPSWQEALLRGADDQPRPLDRWVTDLATEHGADLRSVLELWEKPLIGEEDPPRILDEVIPRLRLQITLGSGNLTDLFGTEDPYFLIIVDGAPPSPDARDQILRRALGVAKVLQDGGHNVVLHRLGFLRPVAAETVQPEEVYPREAPSHPRLLAPLLEAHQEERVRGVLLLLTGDVIDGDDLADGPWVDRIRVHTVGGLATGRPFLRIPPQEAASLAQHLLTA